MKKNNRQKIYILHGWAYSIQSWEPVVTLFKKNGFDPVLLKIPGLTAPLDRVWNLNNYVNWLKTKLDQEKEPVILLGHSNGGRISLAYSYKYPDKIQKLILIDSAGIYHNELPVRIKRIVFITLAKTGKMFGKISILRKQLYKLAREHDYEKASPVMQKTMRNLIKVDLVHTFEHIVVPTIIIWGENDVITSVKDGKLMHRNLRNSTLHIIKHARHSPQFTNTEEVVKIIVKELRK